MIKMNRLVEYSILILSHLSVCSGPLCRASKLAEHTRLPLPTVRKCLRSLHCAGFVRSVSGVRGGYHLVASLSSITLKDLFHAFSQPRSLRSCQSFTEGCGVGDARCAADYCALQSSWEVLSNRIESFMGGVSVEEMLSGLRFDEFPDLLPITPCEESVNEQ